MDCLIAAPDKLVTSVQTEAPDAKKDEFFSKDECSDSCEEGESSSEYAHKVCTVAPKPLQEIIKSPDPSAVEEPMDGSESDDSLPSIPGNLESNDDGTTITISSDEDLEQSMIELDTQNLVSLEMSD